MKALVFILLISFLSASRPYSGDPNLITDMCSTTNDVFLGGETITYKLYYNLNFIWIPAGEVIFNVTEEDDHYALSAYGRTYPSYEWFFKVEDYYESRISKNSLLPMSSLREIQEGSYSKYEEVVFDQEEHEAKSELGKTKEITKSKIIDVKDCIHDVLSVIYYTRNVDIEGLKEGDEFPVRVYMDQELFDLGVKFEGRKEKKKIKGLGKFKTIKLQPQVVDGHVFKKGTEMKVWVSDDKNRVPLLIESPVSVGSIKVVLKEYKGLKYNLDSKW